jgi:hypothetical protein
MGWASYLIYNPDDSDKEVNNNEDTKKDKEK